MVVISKHVDYLIGFGSLVPAFYSPKLKVQIIRFNKPFGWYKAQCLGIFGHEMVTYLNFQLLDN